jgi:hypothetical protein
MPSVTIKDLDVRPLACLYTSPRRSFFHSSHVQIPVINEGGSLLLVGIELAAFLAQFPSKFLFARTSTGQKLFMKART